MVKVGDRIRLSSGKGSNRDGVVVAVTGSMVRVRWPSGEESTVVPGPGTLSVLGGSTTSAPAKRKSAKKASGGKKKSAKKSAKKKSGKTKSAKKASGGKKKSAKKKR